MPGNLQTLPIGKTGIQITWAAVTGADDYLVTRDGGGPVAVRDTNHVAMDLKPSTEYTFTVAARNSAGISEPNVIRAATLFTPAPRPSEPRQPVNLQITGQTTSGFTVTWEDALVRGTILPTDRYLVQIGDADPIAVTDSIYTAVGLTPGIEIPISVTAENRMGRSPTAVITGRTLLSPVPNPLASPPRSLRVTAPTDTTLTVDWLPPTWQGRSSPLAYLVTWEGGQQSTEATSMLVRGLSPATVYTFNVVAINASGWSDPATIRARTLSSPEPNPTPKPTPQPETPPGPPIGPTLSGSNEDGSFSGDVDARTLQQVLPGRWPASHIVVAGKDVFLEKSTRMITNARQRAKGSVTYASPSVASARVVFDRNKRAYVLRTKLKPGATSGSVVLTVAAPLTTSEGVTYEPLHASKRFVVVKRAPKSR